MCTESRAQLPGLYLHTQRVRHGCQHINVYQIGSRGSPPQCRVESATTRCKKALALVLRTLGYGHMQPESQPLAFLRSTDQYNVATVAAYMSNAKPTLWRERDTPTVLVLVRNDDVIVKRMPAFSACECTRMTCCIGYNNSTDVLLPTSSANLMLTVSVPLNAEQPRPRASAHERPAGMLSDGTLPAAGGCALHTDG